MVGLSSDEKCLARQTDIKGSALPVDDILHFDTYESAAGAVLNGEVFANER